MAAAGAWPMKGPIREQDPLKQGLKLGGCWCMAYEGTIREQDPLKQGLKQNKHCYHKIIFRLIREQDPLKQGLKLTKISLKNFYIFNS